MAPRTTDVPADDSNDAAAVPTVVPAEVVTPSPEAATTSGAKLIRCAFPSDRFRIDKSTLIGGEYVEYPATQAKKIIELARVNGVRLLVADVEKKG